MPVHCLQNRFVSPAHATFSNAPNARPAVGRPQARPPLHPVSTRRATHVAAALSNTPHDWHRRLADKAREVNAFGVDVTEAAERLASDKWILIDVRPKAAFAAAPPQDALNIPLFDKPENPGRKDLLKRALLRANDVPYLTYNEGFVDAIKAATKTGRGLIFADDAGGRLVREFADRRGKESRSLKALYIAIDTGLTSVDFLQGGLAAWEGQKKTR